jgi:hypothetical protein
MKSLNSRFFAAAFGELRVSAIARITVGLIGRALAYSIQGVAGRASTRPSCSRLPIRLTASVRSVLLHWLLHQCQST